MIPMPFLSINEISDVTLGGGLLSASRYAYFKFTITSTSTTNVGIKVPIIRNVNCNLAGPASLGLNIQRFNIVGNSPDVLSSSGRPTGFNRDNWTTSSDENYYYIHTSNSTQKSSLTVGEAYWFSFDVRGSACEKNDTITVIDAGPINFIRASFYNVFNTQGITTVLDYNA